MNKDLPPIPAKRYFAIGEVAKLCDLKPHVLRYWEREFTQLRPMKRRGNRRYYQHHEVLIIRRLRELLYEEGLTIDAARRRLQSGGRHDGLAASPESVTLPTASVRQTEAATPEKATGDELNLADLAAELRQLQSWLNKPL